MTIYYIKRIKMKVKYKYINGSQITPRHRARSIDENSIHIAGN